MKIIDISMEIRENMTVYKNRSENRPVLEHTRKVTIDGVNESILHINLHTGTHMDAPWHNIDDGSTIETTELSSCLTPCKVLDFSHIEDRITKNDLESKNICKDDFILLKTRNSFIEEFYSKYVFLEKSGAVYLREIGIKGVGIDCLGIEREQPGRDTHKALLSSNIVILEGLRLKDVTEGEYLLIALPLKIKGADGSPVRAVLTALPG